MELSNEGKESIENNNGHIDVELYIPVIFT